MKSIFKEVIELVLRCGSFNSHKLRLQVGVVHVKILMLSPDD